MTREELLEKMPGDLRPWAEIWLPVLLAFTEGQLIDFLDLAIGADWKSAYRVLVNQMTTDQKIEELKLQKEALKKLNQDNAAFVNTQRQLLLSIIAKLLMNVK